MALPKFSFNVISQEEFDARLKERAVAAATAAWPVQPPRRFSAPVGVVSKLKKKSDSSFSTLNDYTLPKAQVTIPVFLFPVFAMLRVPATILYSSLMLLFLQASRSAMSSSSSPSSQLSDFSATSASDFNIGTVMHKLQCVSACLKTVQSRIDDAMEWKRDIGPVLAELLEHQRNSALSIKALNTELQELRSSLTGAAEVLQTTPSETLLDPSSTHHDA
jgi:hypothetical protein